VLKKEGDDRDMFEYGEVCAVEAEAGAVVSQSSPFVEDFARLHILVSLFDGEPDKWIRFLERNGTNGERQRDLPFVESLKKRMTAEPLLLEDVRRVVRELSTILSH
jgi:hypothetical protein